MGLTKTVETFAAAPGCLEDIKAAMVSDSANVVNNAFKKCVNAAPQDPTRGSTHKPLTPYLYRMGDTSLPIEVTIMRPQFGGPADHIEVHGDANVGAVKFAENKPIKQMDDNYFRGFPAYDQDKIPGLWKTFLESIGGMASPIAGLLGAYYMGWNEHGYNFDGEYAKKLYPTTPDVPIAEYQADARQAAKLYQPQTEHADGAIPDMKEQLVASNIFYPNKRGMLNEDDEKSDKLLQKRAQNFQGQQMGGLTAMNPRYTSRGRFEFGIGRDMPVHRYIPEEELLVWNNEEALGSFEGEGNELWGSIGDNAMRQLN